uniref:Uncharacterized protein n=1 Tax=Arundo donax TaxID=35708 RepID=A0A0A9GVL2_ARUDO
MCGLLFYTNFSKVMMRKIREDGTLISLHDLVQYGGSRVKSQYVKYNE